METSEKEHQHRCLVRWLIKKRVTDRAGAHKFLYGGNDEKGVYREGWNAKNPKSTLENDARDQWAKGNRGEWGDWR